MRTLLFSLFIFLTLNACSQYEGDRVEIEGLNPDTFEKTDTVNLKE